jgi:hypothetical protein
MEIGRSIEWHLGRSAVRVSLLLSHAGVRMRHALTVAEAYRRALRKSRHFRLPA